MFDNLSQKLLAAFDRLRGRGKLSEQDVAEALREVRLALLEADVNFKVVKEFVARVRERAVGHEVLESLTPDQQVVKIVHEELTNLLGGSTSELNLSGSPAVILLVGLQAEAKPPQQASWPTYCANRAANHCLWRRMFIALRL